MNDSYREMAKNIGAELDVTAETEEQAVDILAAALSRLAAEKDAEYAGVVEAAKMRLEYGHNDTCDTALNAAWICSCGHSALSRALASLLAPAEKGKKSACVVCAGGEPGNENLIQGVPLCDDCSHIVSTFLGKIAPAEKGEK